MNTSSAAFPACPCSPGTLQAHIKAIGEIVNGLVAGIKHGRDVDLNKLKRDVSIKYSVRKVPKLVEIMAAVPEEHRSVLLPQ